MLTTARYECTVKLQYIKLTPFQPDFQDCELLPSILRPETGDPTLFNVMELRKRPREEWLLKYYHAHSAIESPLPLDYNSDDTALAHHVRDLTVSSHRRLLSLEEMTFEVKLCPRIWCSVSSHIDLKISSSEYPHLNEYFRARMSFYTCFPNWTVQLMESA